MIFLEVCYGCGFGVVIRDGQRELDQNRLHVARRATRRRCRRLDGDMNYTSERQSRSNPAPAKKLGFQAGVGNHPRS